MANPYLEDAPELHLPVEVKTGRWVICANGAEFLSYEDALWAYNTLTLAPNLLRGQKMEYRVPRTR